MSFISRIIAERRQIAADRSTLTKDVAESYVRNMEWKWGQEGTIERSYSRVDAGIFVWEVFTPSNHWTVWVDGSRGIYGEC